jgi:hypothetical protein
MKLITKANRPAAGEIKFPHRITIKQKLKCTEGSLWRTKMVLSMAYRKELSTTRIYHGSTKDKQE